MSRIAIVTDSSAALPKELAQENDIHVIPMYISFGHQPLRDGVDLTLTEFYLRLRAASTPPRTSQPSAGDFVDLYRRLSESAEAIVSIHISKELSGTVHSAVAARQMLRDEWQSAGAPAVPIHILDSRTVSAALGLIVLAAARAATAGKSASEVVQAAEAVIPRIHEIFTVETLEYLRMGGRIGGASALLGTVLAIKPILYIRDGRIEVLQKVRTRAQAQARLPEIMASWSEPDTRIHVAVLHSDALQQANHLAATISPRFNCDERLVTDIGATIGTHVGPGTLGLAFYADARV